MDNKIIKPLQERTDAKLRYARVHLDELKAQGPPSGNDFDRAHQESFLFHLLGARDAFLAELNYYYRAGLAPDDISLGKLRNALKEKMLEYRDLVRNLQVPYVVTLYADYLSTIEFGELKSCLFDKEESLFNKYPEVSGVLFFEMSAGQYCFNYVKNPNTNLPIIIRDGIFPPNSI